ncbi:MAG TPA: 50S ribosomal protein L18 [Clostridia bacterium]|nr:50S ribosomal protein L18 [Clostridia bacterium]
MAGKPDRKIARQKRRLRVRRKVRGTTQRPRLAVYRSLKNIYAQLIDDTQGVTLVAASTLEEPLRSELEQKANQEAAFKVGQLLAEKALEKEIKQVVFDRGGNLYHGRIKALAEGARKAGLEF